MKNERKRRTIYQCLKMAPKYIPFVHYNEQKSQRLAKSEFRQIVNKFSRFLVICDFDIFSAK